MLYSRSLLTIYQPSYIKEQSAVESGQEMWQTIPGLWGFSLENVVVLLGILSPLCPQLYLTQVPVNTRCVST